MNNRKDTLGGLLVVALTVAAIFAGVAYSQTNRQPVEPVDPKKTYESKLPGDGLKFVWEDRGSVTTFGLIELRGHEYVFARGGGVSIIHAASCPCQRRRDPDGLPPGAFKIIDQKPTEKAEDE